MNQQIFHGSWLLIASLLLSACSTTVPQHSITSVEQGLTKTHPTLSLHTTAPALADEPLSLHNAVQTLLSHSPQVRAQLAVLGIADAQRLQAELISNPHVSIGALKPEGGGRWQLEAGLSQPLLELLTRPLRRQLAEDVLLNTQLRLQKNLQELITETSEKYFSAVAAQQHLQVQQQVFETTKARQELALALYKAGNIPESNFLYYDNELRNLQRQINKRELTANEKRLELMTLIGFESTQPLLLPKQLPGLPQEAFIHSELLAQAKIDRLDIKITRQQILLLEKRRHLIRKQNGWRDMSVGINAEREFDGATNIGPEVEFSLPLFNRGQAKVAAIDAKTTQAQAQLDTLALTTDKEIALAIQNLNTAREQIALLHQALAVAKKRVDLSNREVNFMLTSPFELLNIKRQEIQLTHEFTNELNNYWQARTALELAIGRAITLPENTATPEHEEEPQHHMVDHSMHMKHQEEKPADTETTDDHPETTPEDHSAHEEH